MKAFVRAPCGKVTFGKRPYPEVVCGWGLSISQRQRDDSATVSGTSSFACALSSVEKCLAMDDWFDSPVVQTAAKAKVKQSASKKAAKARAAPKVKKAARARAAAKVKTAAKARAAPKVKKASKARAAPRVKSSVAARPALPSRSAPNARCDICDAPDLRSHGVVRLGGDCSGWCTEVWASKNVLAGGLVEHVFASEEQMSARIAVTNIVRNPCFQNLWEILRYPISHIAILLLEV